MRSCNECGREYEPVTRGNPSAWPICVDCLDRHPCIARRLDTEGVMH